jgi:uncharacterized protein (DUF697 family)
MSCEFVLLPSSVAAIGDVKRRCRALIRKRALLSAGAVLVPVPGLDVAADISLLLRLISEINREFGLTPDQIARLDANTRVLVYQAIIAFGSAMVGKVITHTVVTKALCAVGARVVAKQAVKYVPLAGQAVAAGLSFAAMKYVGEQHIKDCARVANIVIAQSSYDSTTITRDW